MHWFRWGAWVGALTVLPACASAQNPQLTMPPLPADTAPLRLEGQVVRADTALPVPYAQLRLLHEGKPWHVLQSQPDGSFAFDSVPRGHIVLVTRAIGFHARSDSLVLADAPAPRLTIPMQLFPMCLGSCPPDPRLVAAARARQAEWTCDRDEESIAAARERWLDFLQAPAVRAQLGLRPGEPPDPGQLKLVRDPATCRRVALAYDRGGWGVTSLAFTVFRYARWWLISEASAGDGTIYDEHLQPVTGIVLE